MPDIELAADIPLPGRAGAEVEADAGLVQLFAGPNRAAAARLLPRHEHAQLAGVVALHKQSNITLSHH